MPPTWRYGGDPIELPVQCCCNPGRRFGWVRVPKATLGAVKFLVVEPLPAFVGHPDSLRYTTIIEARIDLHRALLRPALLYLCAAGCVHATIPLWIERLAVSSSDYPLATWRQVAGFREEVRS